MISINDQIQNSDEILQAAKAAIGQFNMINGYIQYQKENGYDSQALKEVEEKLLNGESSIHYQAMVAIGENFAKYPDVREAIKEAIKDVNKSLGADNELTKEIKADQSQYILNFRANLADATVSMENTLDECKKALDAIMQNRDKQQKLISLQESIQPIVNKAKAIPGWIKNFVKGTNEIVKQAGKDVFKNVSRFSDIQITKLKSIEKIYEQAKMRQAEVKMKYHETQYKLQMIFYNAKINMQKNLLSIVSPGQQFDVKKMQDEKHPEMIAFHKRESLNARAEMAKHAANIASISDQQMIKFRALNHDYDHDIKGFDSLEKEFNDEPGLKDQYKSAEAYARKMIKTDPELTIDARIKNPEKYSMEQLKALSESKDILTRGQMSMLFDPNLSVDKIRTATAFAEMGFSNQEIKDMILNKDLTKEQTQKVFDAVENNMREQAKLINRESVVADKAAEMARKSSVKEVVNKVNDEINQTIIDDTQKDPIKNDKDEILPQRQMTINMLDISDQEANNLMSHLAQNGIYGDQLTFNNQGVSLVTASPEVAASIQNYVNEHNLQTNVLDTVKSFTKTVDKIADQMVQDSHSLDEEAR